jgi:hypothetical protein
MRKHYAQMLRENVTRKEYKEQETYRNKDNNNNHGRSGYAYEKVLWLGGSNNSHS